MGIILGQIIRNARQTCMHIAATQCFCTDNLARCGLDQRGTRQENCSLLFHDNGDIRHRRDIGTTRGAGPHHKGDLWNTLGTHPRLIVKDAAKMIAVWEHLILIGQIGPTAIDHVNTGQIAFLGDFLGAEVFFDGHGVIGATLYRRIIA